MFMRGYLCEDVEEEWRTVMPPLRKWGTARGLTIPHEEVIMQYARISTLLPLLDVGCCDPLHT